MLSRGKTLSRTPIGWFVWRCAIQKKCQRGWGDRMTDCYCLFDADKSKDVVMLACWGLWVLNSASSLLLGFAAVHWQVVRLYTILLGTWCRHAPA